MEQVIWGDICPHVGYLHKKGDCNYAKLLGTKSWGFLGQLTWIINKKIKEGVGFNHIEIRGIQNNEPQWYKLNQTFTPCVVWRHVILFN